MNTVTKSRNIHLVGYASGLAGVNPSCGQGPLVLRDSSAWQQLAGAKEGFQWEAMLEPLLHPTSLKAELRRLCEDLALKTAELARQKEFFIVSGGDHSSAIGTWSGVYQAIHKQGPLGLIWIDAHMDSHVPETSQSGRYHGMPLASLLGYGDSSFTQLLAPSPKLLPQHLCLIGVRSYEPGEAELLKRLKVRVFFMEEVEERGLAAVFKEALDLVNRGTAAYGISLDVDSLDPTDAPGVDVPEAKGLKLKDLREVLTQVAGDPRFIGAEVAEFNPSQDSEHKTEKAVIELIAAMTGYAQR